MSTVTATTGFVAKTSTKINIDADIKHPDDGIFIKPADDGIFIKPADDGIFIKIVPLLAPIWLENIKVGDIITMRYDIQRHLREKIAFSRCQILRTAQELNHLNKLEWKTSSIIHGQSVYTIAEEKNLREYDGKYQCYCVKEITGCLPKEKPLHDNIGCYVRNEPHVSLSLTML